MYATSVNFPCITSLVLPKQCNNYKMHIILPYYYRNFLNTILCTAGYLMEYKQPQAGQYHVCLHCSQAGQYQVCLHCFQTGQYHVCLQCYQKLVNSFIDNLDTSDAFFSIIQFNRFLKIIAFLKIMYIFKQLSPLKWFLSMKKEAQVRFRFLININNTFCFDSETYWGRL